MAITHVGAGQGTTVPSANTVISLTRTANAINNLFVVGASYNLSTGTPTIADTQLNTWVIVDPVFNDATNVNTLMSWYCFAKNTASTIITVTHTSTNFTSMVLDEFTSTDTTVAVLDKVFHSVAGASGTPTSPSFSPGVADVLVWAYCSDSNTDAALIDGTKGTIGGDDGSQDIAEYRVLTGRSGIAMTAAFAGSGNYDLIGATFKPPQSVAGNLAWVKG